MNFAKTTSYDQNLFQKWSRQLSLLLLALSYPFFTFAQVAEPSTQNLNPNRPPTRVRCEIIFSGYGSTIKFRQSVLQVPHKDPSLDVRVNQYIVDLNKILNLSNPILADFDEYNKAIELLNSEQKKQLVDQVTLIYKEVIDTKYKALKIKEIKRTLDLILARVERPDLLFSKARNSLQAQEIYAQYLETARINSGLNPEYNHKNIFEFLKWMQKSLQTKKLKTPELSQSEIILYGSYVNGRALLKKSDIDVISNNQETSKFISSLNKIPEFQNFQVDHISANSIYKFSEWGAAQLSPILFVVTDRKIVLKVYPPLNYCDISMQSSLKKPLEFVLDF
jgi:predicted nucleotidyltransferase